MPHQTCWLILNHECGPRTTEWCDNIFEATRRASPVDVQQFRSKHWQNDSSLGWCKQRYIHHAPSSATEPKKYKDQAVQPYWCLEWRTTCCNLITHKNIQTNKKNKPRQDAVVAKASDPMCQCIMLQEATGAEHESACQPLGIWDRAKGKGPTITFKSLQQWHTWLLCTVYDGAVKRELMHVYFLAAILSTLSWKWNVSLTIA